jgi:hypothetical protein
MGVWVTTYTTAPKILVIDTRAKADIRENGKEVTNNPAI